MLTLFCVVSVDYSVSLMDYMLVLRTGVCLAMCGESKAAAVRSAKVRT